mmetsp:Transcript_47513/g.137238  ORF Transcript_47513/g.137238 Transcript_47513/m.137238 type:complete len:262 (-) Transcript_47513:812-1597(-)
MSSASSGKLLGLAVSTVPAVFLASTRATGRGCDTRASKVFNIGVYIFFNPASLSLSFKLPVTCNTFTNSGRVPICTAFNLSSRTSSSLTGRLGLLGLAPRKNLWISDSSTASKPVPCKGSSWVSKSRFLRRRLQIPCRFCFFISSSDATSTQKSSILSSAITMCVPSGHASSMKRTWRCAPFTPRTILSAQGVPCRALSYCPDTTSLSSCDTKMRHRLDASGPNARVNAARLKSKRPLSACFKRGACDLATQADIFRSVFG